jgi:sulfopyruvate decarboxylase TPP-binding subunit
LFEIFEQDSLKHVDEDPLANDHKRHEVRYGHIAVRLNELEHGRVPVFTSKHSEDQYETIEEITKVAHRLTLLRIVLLTVK